MKIIYLGEHVEVQPKKRWNYKGVDLVLHRPYNSETQWNVSEFRTGRQVGRSGKTMSEAIERAQLTVDHVEKSFGGNHVVMLYINATPWINADDTTQKVGDMVQGSLF